jgi:hypothetical protein
LYGGGVLKCKQKAAGGGRRYGSGNQNGSGILNKSFVKSFIRSFIKKALSLTDRRLRQRKNFIKRMISGVTQFYV